MALVIQRETTEYVFFGVTGDPPSVSAEVAFLAAGVRPQTEDWETAILVTGSGHALWDDAKASGVSGTYFVARLIGPFGGNDVVLGQGLYQPWLRLTDDVERPVRIAPEILEVQ